MKMQLKSAPHSRPHPLGDLWLTWGQVGGQFGVPDGEGADGEGPRGGGGLSQGGAVDLCENEGMNE